MRNANKALLTLGSAVMLASSGVAMAGPPGNIAYGGYTVSGGVITAPCPPAASSCGTPITGTGFLQRNIVVGGVTYFQTIIYQPGTGTDIFKDESFVQQGGGTGIADSQQLIQAGTAGNPGDFASNSAINAGWAQGVGESVISLSQSVNDPSNGFNVGFALTGDGTNPLSLTVTQNICLESVITNCTNSTYDHQTFDLRQLQATSNGSTVTGTFFPTSISWTGNATTGDIIQAIWMGQTVTTTPQAGSTPAVQQAFGYQGYTNITTDSAISYSDQTTPGPFAYAATASVFTAAPFSGAPTF